MVKRHCRICKTQLINGNHNPKANKSICTKCNSEYKKQYKEKRAAFFKQYNIDYRARNAERNKERCKDYRLANLDSLRAVSRKYSKSKEGRASAAKSRHKSKIIAFHHYCGGAPRCKCGQTDMRTLSIDHINGNGETHRKNNKSISGSCHMSRWLIKNGLPIGYQVLCMNCQWEKRVTNNELNVSDTCTPHAMIQRKLRIKIKNEVMTHYCNGKARCVYCGYGNINSLSIDHIDGNGAEHRRQLGKQQKIKSTNGGYLTYIWLRKNNYPPNYQVLCMNCQYIKRFENAELNQYKKTD